jgi:acyl-CoA reductase-like NAD-dependent aldehyde dehydrogenase
MSDHSSSMFYAAQILRRECVSGDCRTHCCCLITVSLLPHVLMGSNTKTLRSSITDGIAITPRYRERQLSSLHRGLSAAKDELLSVLRSGAAITQAEAVVEYLLTLNAIKSFHTTCDPASCREEEYTIANSKDYNDRRIPYGYAYISPANADSLYSTVVPLAAAISAGNVVLLQQPSNSNPLATELEKLLRKVLSSETFTFVERDPFDPKFQQARGIMFEGKSSPNAVTTSRRICSPTLCVAAVVDRSADIKIAAKDLVRARFAFGGSSSYAPDIVLVNEFAVKEFSEAAVEAGLRHLSQGINGTTHASKSKPNTDGHLSNELEKHGMILVAGDGGRVVLVRSRQPQLFSQKVNSPTLLIVPISSMDDAIDLLNSVETSLLANYVYAAPAAGKYITQFVRSAASFVNHVPAELLVGGPAPAGLTPSIHPRYTATMFSVSSPALIHESARSQAVTSLVALSDTKQQRRLEAALDVSLGAFKEPFGPKIGFFEQGFLFNASLILSGIVAGAYCGIKYGYPALASALQK